MKCVTRTLAPVLPRSIVPNPKKILDGASLDPHSGHFFGIFANSPSNSFRCSANFFGSNSGRD